MELLDQRGDISPGDGAQVRDLGRQAFAFLAQPFALGVGVHMEADINVIVDVDPDEARLLIGLLETLVDDWYVVRYERQERMKKLIEVAESKETGKKAPGGTE